MELSVFITIRENSNPVKKIAYIDIQSIQFSLEKLLEATKLSEKTRLYNDDGFELSSTDIASLHNEDTIYADKNGNDFSFKTYLYQYEKIQPLGEGGFGRVFKARNIINNKIVAIKYIDISYCMQDSTKLQEIYKESNALRNLSHKNIVKLYSTFLHEHNVVLIMEYCEGGELKKYVLDNNFIPEHEARCILLQLMDALIYCHGRYVIHRDIKMENIIFNSATDHTIKLIDFGIAGTNYGQQGSKVNAGSLLYMAPEIFKGNNESSPAIDIWSMGVLLYVMIYGKMPFSGKSEDASIHSIVNSKHTFPTDRTVSSQCKNLIDQMLIKDPEKRIKMYEISCHSWFKLEYTSD